MLRHSFLCCQAARGATSESRFSGRRSIVYHNQEIFGVGHDNELLSSAS